MSRSESLFANAQKHIPGGVNSPVRAFKSVGGTPLFFKHAEGAYVTDEDDKRYVDYVGSWGPMILGHSHPEVLDAVRQQLQHGLSYGAPTAMETEMADLVCSIVPSMEMVRMVSSGTEATMSAYIATGSGPRRIAGAHLNEGRGLHKRRRPQVRSSEPISTHVYKSSRVCGCVNRGRMGTDDREGLDLLASSSSSSFLNIPKLSFGGGAINRVAPLGDSELHL